MGSIKHRDVVQKVHVMNLVIVTDLDDVAWLEYILEEYRRLSSAKFKIKVELSNYVSDCDDYCLSYFPYKVKNMPGIYRGQNVNSSNFVTIDDVQILNETTTNDTSFLFSYDIFWNCFFYISRLAEYEQAKSGRNTNSYSFRHPGCGKVDFLQPTVNLIFQSLTAIIRRLFPNLEFYETKANVVELSHDVDYVSKTMQLRIKQAAFNLFNALKHLTSQNLAFKYLRRSATFGLSNSSYWFFDEWRDLEQKFDLKSTFYVYAGSTSKGFRSWLLDPSYSVNKDLKLVDTLKKLHSNNFEIGLHGSYFSALNSDLLREEKHRLEQALGFNIKKTRQHWLNFDEIITPLAHEELFDYDSTLGWNDSLGFRSGCASVHRPYNHAERRPFNYYVIPQVIMDSTLYDYAGNDYSKIFENAKTLLINLKKLDNVHVSISWHQRVMSKDYMWHESYAELLPIINNSSATAESID